MRKEMPTTLSWLDIKKAIVQNIKCFIQRYGY